MQYLVGRLHSFLGMFSFPIFVSLLWFFAGLGAETLFILVLASFLYPAVYFSYFVPVLSCRTPPRYFRTLSPQ